MPGGKRFRVALVAGSIVAAIVPVPVHATTSPVNWEQESPATSPAQRTFAASSYDSGRNRVVMFGGWNGSTHLGDTWEFDGTTWANVAAAVAPPAVSNAAMAYDPTRGVSVLFGGYTNSGLSADTWEWNGVAWNLRSPASSPPAMGDIAMTYDSSNGRMLLFGEFDSPFDPSHVLAQAETWEYDGSSWTQMHPASSPSPRLGQGLAFDAIRGRAVLFGGRDPATGARLADTWEWDGTNWSQVATPITPYPRFWQSMSFDPVRGRVVLFGGDHIQPYSLGEENDTWDWDGTQWTRDWTDAAPSIRSGQTMVYDSALGRMVMFGGWNAGVTPNVYDSDTWELGPGIVTPAGSPALTPSSPGFDFGSVDVGTSTAPNPLFVTSSGSGSAITSVSISGDFAITSTDCPGDPDPLAAGTTCVVFLAFSPTAPGDRTGSLTFTGNLVAGSLVVPLHGVGIAADFSISVSPATINTTAGFPLPAITVSTTQVGAAGTVALSALYSDPAISATFSPASISAGSPSTATITISPYVPGFYTVRVVGTEGSTSHYADVNVQVHPVPDFTMATDTSSVSLAHGSSASVGIDTTAINGALSIAMTATSSPAGPTLSIAPFVPAGSVGILTIAAPFGVAPGQYTVTVTGTADLGTQTISHSASLMVTVTTKGFANGDFETGDLGGWSEAGVDSVVKYPVHSGVYAAEIGTPGLPTPFVGDSTLSQTFDVPATASKLVFWFWTFCNDKVKNDWFTATLQDGVTGSTTTLLAPECTKNGGWSKVTVNMSSHAGHYVTLTFLNHDNGIGSTETYTFVDDASLT